MEEQNLNEEINKNLENLTITIENDTEYGIEILYEVEHLGNYYNFLLELSPSESKTIETTRIKRINICDSFLNIKLEMNHKYKLSDYDSSKNR